LLNMNNIADARINNFGIAKENSFPQSSEELEAFVCRITQPLQDRIDALEAELELRALEIAQDRRRIARLEAPEAQPKQKDRREVLLSILVANGGKMPSQEARRLMELPANRFSELLATMRDVIEVKPWRTRSRKYNLIYLRHSSAETGSMPGY